MTTTNTTPAEPDTSPDLTAVVALIRRLFAAGWVADYAHEMADGSAVRGLIHPSGREIEARVYPHQTCLTLSGLTMEQAVGAVDGAGLAPDAESSPGLLAAARAVVEAARVWRWSGDTADGHRRAEANLMAAVDALNAAQGGTR